MMRSLVLAMVLVLGVGSAPASALPSSEIAGVPSGSERAKIQKDFSALTKKVSQYIDTDDSGEIHFNRRAAERDGVSQDVLETGRYVNELAMANNPGSNDVMSRAISLPIWGNWCGPGHGGGTAVDVLDSICKTHDDCYGSRGYFSCSCDRAIVNDISRDAYRMKITERFVAGAINVYFTFSACNPFR